MSTQTEEPPTVTTPTPPQHKPRLSVFPGISEIRSAARDTNLLLKLRWRFVRSTKSRFFIVVGFAVFLLSIFIASQVGTLIRRYAEQGVETAAGQFAVNYVIALNRGELGTIGAGAVGSVIIVALFTPFTGSGMQALASTEDLSGLRPTRIHRYFDSIITNAASAIGFLQLVTLTGIGSLLTLDGGRTGGLLFIWSVWPVLLLLSVCTGWAIELTARKYGRNARWAAAATFIVAIATAIYFDPDKGTTLFGVSDQIAATLGAAANGETTTVVRNLGIVAVLAIIMFIVGLALSRAALALPAPVPVRRTERRRLISISRKPDVALMQILFAQLVRSPEVRRPMLTVLIIGVPAVWFAGNINILTTMVIAVPLAVALAFGINVFGVLGPAMPWLASQPHLMRRLLRYCVLLQFSITMGVSMIIWTPATLGGRLALDDLAAVAAGTLVSTALTTRSAAHKSVNRPHLMRVGTRGDMIVPPLTAINYTIRFAFLGQLGVLAMTQDGLIQLALVVVPVTWSCLRFAQLFKQWEDPLVPAYVTKQVAAA